MVDEKPKRCDQCGELMHIFDMGLRHKRCQWSMERRLIQKPLKEKIVLLEGTNAADRKTIADQTGTIEKMKTAVHDCIERPKGVVPDSAVEFYDMRGPAIIKKPNAPDERRK